MLWTLLASALLLAGRVTAQCITDGTGLTQSGNNYVVDYFSGSLLFSYATNKCTGVDLVDTVTSYIYTCSKDTDDMWWVTKTVYTSAGCTGTGEEEDKWSEADMGEAGTVGYFKCDGNDNFAGLQISTDTSCGAAVTVYGGLGGCAQNPAAFDTKFYCDQTSALVQLYTNPSNTNTTASICDDDELYCNVWTFGSTCTLSAQLGTNLIYGKMISCSVETTTTASSASSHFTLLGLIVALVASMMH